MTICGYEKRQNRSLKSLIKGSANGRSELPGDSSSPPDSNNEFLSCSEATKDEEDAWYNLPSDSEDEDDDSVAPALTLPLRLAAVTSTAFTIVKPVKKEHSTGARIKAIYMLYERQPWPKIKAVTGISQSRVYGLAAVAKERE
jgi:hypothetical protein